MMKVRFVTVCLLLTFAACHTETVATRTPADVEAARRAVIEWLECDECEPADAKAVTSYGDFVVPMLRAALIDGPSPATKATLRAELEHRYDELAAQQAKSPNARVASTKEDFVTRNLARVDLQYRTQAATALAAIKTAAAKSALEEGLRSAPAADLRAAVKAAAESASPSQSQ